MYSTSLSNFYLLNCSTFYAPPLNTLYLLHRVYRGPGSLSSRPNWVPPPPHPTSECCSSPFGFKGGVTLAWGGGGTQFRRRDRHSAWYSMYTTIYPHYTAPCQSCSLPVTSTLISLWMNGILTDALSDLGDLLKNDPAPSVS
jgi:hypothetical protein